MARRGGILARIGKALSRIGDALQDFFGVPEEPPPEPPRRRFPPEPEPPPPPPEPPPEPPLFNDEARIWRNVTVGNDRYDMDAMRDWLQLYEQGVGALDLPRDEFLQFWDEFLRAYYLTRAERGSLTRDRFHRNIGIRRRDWEMDWDEWRALKRGTP